MLNGCKRWIGNATFAEVVVVWARNLSTKQINAFVVRKGTPGFKTSKIENKIALRCVQNADIQMKDVFVPGSARLTGVNSFQVSCPAVLVGSDICTAGLFWPYSSTHCTSKLLYKCLKTQVSMQTCGFDQHGAYMGTGPQTTVRGQFYIVAVQSICAAVICHSTLQSAGRRLSCMPHPPCSQASTAKGTDQ